MDKVNKSIIIGFLKVVFYFGVPMEASVYLFHIPLLNALSSYPVFIFIALMAVFNAIMDSVENEHILSTVFSRLLPESFWSKRVSWDKSFEIFGYKFDSWHITKSLFIFAFLASCIAYKNMFGPVYDFLLMGAWYNLIFNGFYSNLFIIKK